MTTDGATDAAAHPEVAFRDLPPGDVRWEDAFGVLQQLRTHLDAATFAAVHRTGAEQGLRFTGAFDPQDRCVGIAGWRIADTTHVIRQLYVDDLVVDAECRSTGVGAALLRHLESLARVAGCRVITLDSGHQRTDAHRFYRREGCEDRSAHFAKDL